MVVDQNNTIRPYYVIPYNKIPNISNSHNSVIFKARRPNFYMVVDLHNINRPYHSILDHTIPYYSIPSHIKSYQIFERDQDNTIKPYHAIP